MNIRWVRLTSWQWDEVGLRESKMTDHNSKIDILTIQQKWLCAVVCISRTLVIKFLPNSKNCGYGLHSTGTSTFFTLAISAQVFFCIAYLRDSIKQKSCLHWCLELTIKLFSNFIKLILRNIFWCVVNLAIRKFWLIAANIPLPGYHEQIKK